MDEKKFREKRKRITYRYRKKNIEKIRKQDRERKQKALLKKQLVASQKIEMEELYEAMKPSLFKWARYYASHDKTIEIHDLVNVAFANGNLRRITNPKLWSKRIAWIMKDYVKKIKRNNSINKLVQMHIEIYGELPFGVKTTNNNR
ncbi:hypothetical protein KAR91_20830 [Candidatus Pacearchaeota archaeon]|nr:hypothetical protein [Candidatus Pacearchaeota archaeon]